MCYAIKYLDQQNKTWIIDFSNHKAALPVIKKNGTVDVVTWGKRKDENVPYFHYGGWVNLDIVKSGNWARFQPVVVSLPIVSHLEKDGERKSHWFDVKSDEVIQGLLLSYNDTSRVYIVTTDSPSEVNFTHDRWPRFMPKPYHQNG